MKDPVFNRDGKWWCYRENYDDKDKAGPFPTKRDAERWYKDYCDSLTNDEWD